MSVKVGVRVRPFNKREEQMGAKLVIQMEGSTTSIIDSEGGKKTFNYDYSFWSHDGFRTEEDQYNSPIGDKYADQRKVYEEIGSSILTNAWQGYNCCLFAYGQTGSGKSYSMIGYGANKGIIPIVCNQIFQKIRTNQDGTRSFEVQVSMLQIYNQAVKDLLSKGKKNELKICESKTLGVYVEGLTKHNVDSYQKIQKKIDEGSNNRSIAATLMNQSSSRSHTIVSINFVQKIQVSMEQTSVKYSVIHLVDLAGSECVAKTGANTKDRLREAAKINQSLSTLGRVIQILAQNCSKKEKDKAFVPYRDSKLTFILRSALGGNSRTAMICAISPADDNYEQTLSTLRYASRAKKIQNKAVVNESDVDKLIRVLRQQNQMLKKMLELARQTKGEINYDMISNFNEMNKNMTDMGILGIKEEESVLQDMEGQTNDPNNQSVSISPIEGGVNQNLPYITNISEDQLLSFRIKYSCEKLMIGNRKGNPKPDVVLASLGIQPNHALISFDSDENRCFLDVFDQNSASYCFVNGGVMSVGVKEELFHLDRIVFGTGCAFLVMFKGSTPRNQKLTLKQIDYQFAIGQVQNSNPEKPNGVSIVQKYSAVQEQQLRKKLATQIQQQFQISMKESEEEMKKHIEEKEKEYHQKLKDIELKKEAETARLKQELEEREEESRKLEGEREKIKSEVEKYLQETKVSKQRQEQGKEQLEQTKQALEKKMRQIRQLQERMNQLQAKTETKREQLKHELKEQEQDMKNQLELHGIICHNQNVINQYKLGQNKRSKHANNLRQLMVKKQRIQVQKALIQLVPLIQRFNLIAKEMSKKVESGLSIEYRYISDTEIIQSSKNVSYKSKLKITVHIINRDEGRSYYWPLDIFRNRYEHALELWEGFIRAGQHFRIEKQNDPYWDPETYQTVAYAHLTLECLMFNLSFAGELAIVKGGEKIGKLSVNLYPTDSLGTTNTGIEGKGEDGTFRITNPHQQKQKNIYFVIEISSVEFKQSTLDFQSFKFQYELLEGIKLVKHATEVAEMRNIRKFKYRKFHMLKEVSQTTILHFLQKPIVVELQIVQKVDSFDELTHRSSFSHSTNKGSFANQFDTNVIQPIEIEQFDNISPPKTTRQGLKNSNQVSNFNSGNKSSSTSSSPNIKKSVGVIYQNTEITQKVDEEYQRKKASQSGGQINMKKKKTADSQPMSKSKKDKDCLIY